MPEIYFNPYPSPAQNSSEGQKILLDTAKAVYSIKQYLDQALNPQVDNPIKTFVLYRNKSTGVHYTITNEIYTLKGKDREIVKYFLRLFDKGQVITNEDLNICQDWTLKKLELPAPVLEFAIRNQGLTATLATEKEWQCDFIEFNETEKTLPNVWGQSDLDAVLKWIDEWNKIYSSFINRLKNEHGLQICSGAFKQYVPSPSEYEITLNTIQKGSERGFKHDSDLVKDIKYLTYGTLKQVKDRSSGIRIYIAITQQQGKFLAGFYKKGKGDNRAQKKAIHKAMDRINK